ncbi:MAG: hypothetical protein JRG71_05570 [Deltaproteobacteria bacterium]|nr:hypothetical protein [Deltaproteobacteria bacterium]
MSNTPAPEVMSAFELEDRMLRHAAKLVFLSDAFSQTKDSGVPEFEMHPDSSFGLSVILFEMYTEAEAFRTARIEEVTNG